MPEMPENAGFSGERRAHVGRSAKALEDSFNIYSDETIEAEDKAFMLLSE